MNGNGNEIAHKLYDDVYAYMPTYVNIEYLNI
jgi:hypothetical protein